MFKQASVFMPCNAALKYNNERKTTWVNFQVIMQSEKKPIPNGSVLYDSIHETFLK